MSTSSSLSSFWYSYTRSYTEVLNRMLKVQNSPASTVAASVMTAAHSSSAPSPHAPWPQFMSPDQLYVNHSQRCVVWPVTEWPQPPLPPHVDTSPITTPHWLSLPAPPAALPTMRQQYRHVRGEWMGTPPQENGGSSGVQELYQPYIRESISQPHGEWQEIPRPSKMMTMNSCSCPWSRPATPYHTN
ncbi:uncharacterized protein [Dysidea avara]|uniref:uncharacterized protein isoform X2 n=1 Tax=Dysidea avara TaxID=196820 RepID=UPI003326D2D2